LNSRIGVGELMGVGMGLGELVLILMIVAVAFGAKMPGPGDPFARWMRGAGRDSDGKPEDGRRAGGWTTVDWLLLATTVAIAATLTMALLRSR
jgi:hypothetical protein